MSGYCNGYKIQKLTNHETITKKIEQQKNAMRNMRSKNRRAPPQILSMGLFTTKHKKSTTQKNDSAGKNKNNDKNSKSIKNNAPQSPRTRASAAGGYKAR